MPADSVLTIVTVYPRLLGTYGDGGNALILAARSIGRGIPARVLEVDTGAALPVGADLYCLGGGEDANQYLAAEHLLADGGLGRAVTRGATVLGVCAGLQLLGHHFTDGAGGSHPGLGLLDLSCGRLAARAVGEVVVEATGVPGLPALTGFENHRGDAVLGAGTAPLGTVRVGIGNGPDRREGAVQGKVVATYLHGPVLARNPALADHLLSQALGQLPPLTDLIADRLHEQSLDRALGRRVRLESPAGTPKSRWGRRTVEHRSQERSAA